MRQESWLNVMEALDRKYLQYIDLEIAEKLLRSYPKAGEDSALFLCYLSSALREGHLCVQVEADKLTPSLENLWLREGIASSLLHELLPLIIKGASSLPASLFVGENASVQRVNNFFYFKRYWKKKEEMLTHLKELLTKPIKSLNEKLLQKEIFDISSSLLPEQVSALELSAKSSLTFICGGPGTGKTYTAGHIIKTIWKTIDDQQKKKFEIALAAPTGKAAGNLQQSLKRSTAGLKDFPPLQAKTLHSLLGISKYKSPKEGVHLSADLVIVDESSMIDLQLMTALLAAIKPGARVVFLGDPDQLPPVSTGMIFADMVNLLPDRTIVLKKCQRTDLAAILQFSSAVKQGNEKTAFEVLQECKSGISFSPLTNLKALVDYLIPLFLQNSQHENLSHLNQFKVLCPLRQGPFGIEALNRAIKNLISKERLSEPFVAPIILTSNDHSLELYNGDMGLIITQNPDKECSGNYALFPSRDESLQSRRLPEMVLPNWEYSYCLSVHKSQGSEFDHALVLLPEGAEHFGREMLYTAATRARKKLEIWGSEEVIKKTICKQTLRLSGINK